MLATLEIEVSGPMPVARLAGEVDASNAGDFAARLKDALPNSAMGLVLDMSATSYIDSSGVHMIFDLADALRRRQQRLHLVVAPDTFVEDVLKAVNVTGAAGTSPTLPEALDAIRTDA